MTSFLVRLSAILSAALALAGVALWLLQGAPNAIETDLAHFAKAEDAMRFFQGGTLTFASIILSGMRDTAPWISETALFMTAASVALSAIVGLYMLVRGPQAAYVRHLGVALSCFSLGVGYLWLYSVVPGFQWLQMLPLPARLVLDVLAFQLLLVASQTAKRFMWEFPRPVTEEELATFLIALRREQYGFIGRLRRMMPGHRDDGETAGMHALDLQPVPSHRLVPRPVIVVALALIVFIASLFWRPSRLAPDVNTASLMLIVSFICFMFILLRPGLQALRLFKLHRTVGSPEDRRRIEWVSTAMWIALSLTLLSACVAAILSVSAETLLDLHKENIGIRMLELSMFAGVVIGLIAMTLSILYRGDLDPRLALRGFTVWTLLGVVLTLIFVFIERSIAQKAVALLGLPPQTSLLTAGAIVAATFQPIRKQSEKVVNRFVERVLPATVLASGQRHTAAVGIADISGYTALSAQDEQSALVASALLQKEARRLADKHGGRMVKSTGDGVILCFTRAEPALAAVQELHSAVARNSAALDLKDLRLHSGMHWGEIVEMHDGDIYGQTVNLTARIADWAKAGEIGASQVFYEQLQDQPAGFEVMGPQAFKNIPQPVACLKMMPS